MIQVVSAAVAKLNWARLSMAPAPGTLKNRAIHNKKSEHHTEAFKATSNSEYFNEEFVVFSSVVNMSRTFESECAK